MRGSLIIATTEWHLQWRSAGLWAAAALATVYAVGGAMQAGTYLGAALQIGSWLASVFVLAMSLVWIAAGHRPSRHKTQEMVDSSSAPRPLRLAEEMLGGAAVALLVAFAVTALGVVGLFLTPLTDLGFPPGLARDLWLVPLMAGPAVVFWLGASRFLARLLPASAAYASVLVLWAMGLWLRAPASYLAPTYSPGGGSELTLLGPEAASRLVGHRLALLVLGFLLGLGACLERPATPKGRRAIGILLTVALVGALMGLPGALLLFSSPGASSDPLGWLAQAESSPRWVETAGPEGGASSRGERALLAVADGRWADETLGALRTLEGAGSSPGAPLTVVEAPIQWLTAVTAGGQVLVVVPERVFRVPGRTSPGMIQRRLIAQWVVWLTDSAAEANDASKAFAGAGCLASDGARLYLEWVLSRSVLGTATTVAEVEAWREELARVSSPSTASLAPRPKESPESFPSDVDFLVRWRGGSPIVADTSLSVAAALWDGLGEEPRVDTLVRAYRLWAPATVAKETLDPIREADSLIEVYRELEAGS